MPRKKRAKNTNQVAGGPPLGVVNNPKGTPENLIPGQGRPLAITMATIPPRWIKFCRRYAITNGGSNARDAAIFAGFSPEYGGHLLQHPVIKEYIQHALNHKEEENEKALIEDCVKIALSGRLAREKMVEILESPPHEKRGYCEHVSVIKTALELEGEIAGRGIKIQNNNSAQAAASNQSTFDVYESAWLRKRKEAFNDRLETKYSDGVPDV